METIRILKKLIGKGIKAIPSRGFFLAEEIYGKVYLRAFSDIDLFVFKEDLWKAIEILKNDGYSFNGETQKEEFLKKFHFKLYNEYKMYKDNFMVELHFDLLPKRFRYPGNFKDYLEIQKVQMEDFEFYRFSREWEVIMISIHAFLHRFSLLKFIFDIHSFLKKFDIDYEKIYKISERLKILRMIKLSLTLSHLLFKTKIPSFMKFKRVPDLLKDFIFKENDPLAFKKDLLTFLFINSLSEKIFYVLTLLNPDESIYKNFPLPESLFFLYYPLRILSIIKGRLTF